MRLVIDANIVFAALIKEGMTKELIFNDRLELYTTDVLWEEMEKYKELLERKTQRTSLDEIIRLLKRRITTIDTEQLVDATKNFSPDPDDFAYLVLAQHLGCALWSNDAHLKEQSIVRVYTTEELRLILNER